MSEPKRYAFSPEFSTDDCTMQTDDGCWVKYDDYARLKAEVMEIRKLIDKRMVPLPERTTLEEVERICSAHLLMGITINKIGNLNILLEEQVERLTKAGDAMAEDLPPFGSVLEWRAAKEGKQS